MSGAEAPPAVAIRPLARADLPDVVRIDALHTGRRTPSSWRRLFREAF